MPSILFLKLLAIFVIVAIGWVMGRLKWLGDGDSARVLSNAAFYIFIPALLFRTMVRLDMAHLPWSLLAAFFGPATVLLLSVYLWQQRRTAPGALPLPPAAPAVRAMSSAFGNNVQVGLPLVAALFGEAGLSIHIAIISLHSLVLMTTATALAETNLARQRQQQGGTDGPWRTLAVTARNTLIHPVVLPILCGLAWQGLFGGLPPLADEILLTLSQAVIPLCLVLIGLSLAHYGLRGAIRQASVLVALKLLVLPAAVLGAARWGWDLSGVPLAVVVLAASLPIGVNALIFAQRYEALEAEATSAVVLSTLCFMLSAPLWLAVLSALGSVPFSP
jgi:malonate transporter and related proteins